MQKSPDDDAFRREFAQAVADEVARLKAKWAEEEALRQAGAELLNGVLSRRRR